MKPEDHKYLELILNRFDHLQSLYDNQNEINDPSNEDICKEQDEMLRAVFEKVREIVQSTPDFDIITTSIYGRDCECRVLHDHGHGTLDVQRISDGECFRVTGLIREFKGV